MSRKSDKQQVQQQVTKAGERAAKAVLMQAPEYLAGRICPLNSDW
ncbi:MULTISPECIES: hypothetical protein [Marinomonas]|jgi:hypothetical protein|uniref:Uncharacterized protein n=1 Tax=Marinomonas rhodophyticola TaxID=2992803 RepID=A0ABT3KD68_9GAMM|nr:hypothetical protein [Marinomonas sp. KJ51-3]MCW4628469.1 hypothetical protein [Marinomonas sp. KJ51-3]